jgi:hypothetical protein
VQALIIDVMEPEETARAWAQRWKFTFPVLLDADGTVAESYAPAGALPDLPRSQVPIASNLIIDPDGRIRFYTLLDSVNFDARLVALRTRLDELLAERGRAAEEQAPVVTLDPPSTFEVAPGRTTPVRLRFRVAPGHYVQANPAAEPFLVPLKLEMQESGGVRPGSVRYPPGRPYRLPGSTRDLSVYGDPVELTLPLIADAGAAAAGVLEGVLRYQACNDRVCLRPRSVPVMLRFRCLPRGARPRG